MAKGLNRTKTSFNFVPAPGIIIIDPFLKTEKSDWMEVADSVDDPRRGVVVAVGPVKPYDSNPDKFLNSPVNVGEIALYSIVGCEKTRLKYKEDLRHEFVVAPFARILGVIQKQNG